jgi:hypothetical protein
LLFYHEIAVIEVIHITSITNTCKTNKLRNVNAMWWGRRDVTNQKWKTDDGERKNVSFVVNAYVKVTLKRVYIQTFTRVPCNVSLIQCKSFWLLWFMMFKATFNNISVISWRSVLLVEETRVPVENHRHSQTLSHNVVSSTPRH